MRRERLIAGWLLAAATVAAGPAGDAAEVRLVPRGVSLPVAGELVVLAEGGGEPLAVLPLADLLEVATPPAATVTCRGNGLWCPEVALGEEPALLALYPAVEVRARIGGPGAAGGLRDGSVQGVVRDEGARPLEFQRELDVEEDLVRFEAPRALLDLRFAFPGAAPVYRWSLAPPEPEKEAVIDLGTLRLVPGASLSGRVVSEESAAPIPEAAIRATPLGDRSDDPNQPGAALREIEAKSNDRGFFQLHGLDPGTYRVEITARGLATRVLDVVDLPEASEKLLGIVHLGSPILLSVQVDPPEPPGGGVWRLAIRRAQPGEKQIELTADASGVARTEIARPGDHYLQVFGPAGEAFHFESRDLSRSEWVRVDVPIVVVEGEVRLGGEPIAAHVRLQGGAGDRSDVESDGEGKLAGWMRRPERPWLMADVTWQVGGQEKQRTVEVIPELDEKTAEIRIDLPDGVISGEVVDPDGVAQAGVRVMATPEEGASMYTEVKTTTDRSGRFHLTGLEDGRYLVQAGGNGGPASEIVGVDLLALFPSGETRLVLWPTRPVTVTVTIGGQPAMGARVGLDGIGSAPVAFGLSTDAEGRAVFALPEAVDRVVATLFDPGRFLWSGCLPIEDGQVRVDLPVVQTGSLRLETAFRNDLPPLLASGAVLWTGNGGFVPMQVLTNWTRLRGGTQTLAHEENESVEVLQIPGLAPGSYGIGWSGAPSWEMAARACLGAVSDAEWTTVPAGGEASLQVDASRRQERRLRELRESGRR